MSLPCRFRVFIVNGVTCVCKWMVSFVVTVMSCSRSFKQAGYDSWTDAGLPKSQPHPASGHGADSEKWTHREVKIKTERDKERPVRRSTFLLQVRQLCNTCIYSHFAIVFLSKSTGKKFKGRTCLFILSECGVLVSSEATDSSFLPRLWPN